MSEHSSYYPELARDIAPPQGKLGVLLPGLGAVATTLIAGVHLVNKGLARPYGSLTQMQKIRLGKRTGPRFVPIKELVPLASLEDLAFGGWDIFPDDAYVTACAAGVLPPEMLAPVRHHLEAIRPWPAVFEHAYVRRLQGPHVKTGASKMDLAEALIRDIEDFRSAQRLRRGGSSGAGGRRPERKKVSMKAKRSPASPRGALRWPEKYHHSVRKAGWAPWSRGNWWR